MAQNMAYLGIGSGGTWKGVLSAVVVCSVIVSIILLADDYAELCCILHPIFCHLFLYPIDAPSSYPTS